MSHLRHRTSRRGISRPNAAKALNRLEDDLRVIVANPTPAALTVRTIVARAEIDRFAARLFNLVRLYYGLPKR